MRAFESIPGHEYCRRFEPAMIKIERDIVALYPSSSKCSPPERP